MVWTASCSAAARNQRDLSVRTHVCSYTASAGWVRGSTKPLGNRCLFIGSASSLDRRGLMRDTTTNVQLLCGTAWSGKCLTMYVRITVHAYPYTQPAAFVIICDHRNHPFRAAPSPTWHRIPFGPVLSHTPSPARLGYMCTRLWFGGFRAHRSAAAADSTLHPPPTLPAV